MYHIVGGVNDGGVYACGGFGGREGEIFSFAVNLKLFFKKKSMNKKIQTVSPGYATFFQDP